MESISMPISRSNSHCFYKLIFAMLATLMLETLILNSLLRHACFDRTVHIYYKQLLIYHEDNLKTESRSTEIRQRSDKMFLDSENKARDIALVQKSIIFKSLIYGDRISNIANSRLVDEARYEQKHQSSFGLDTKCNTKEDNSAQVMDPLPDICNGYAPFLLVMVLPPTRGRLRRDTIRNTWGKVGRVRQPSDKANGFKSLSYLSPSTGEVKVMFTIDGKSYSGGVGKSSLKKEQLLERDLLLTNSTSGNYLGLLHSALTFVLNCCPGTRYILLVTAPDNATVDLSGLIHNLYRLKGGHDDQRGVLSRPNHSTREMDFSDGSKVKGQENGRADRKHYFQTLPTGSYVIPGRAVSSILEKMHRSSTANDKK